MSLASNNRTYTYQPNLSSNLRQIPLCESNRQNFKISPDPVIENIKKKYGFICKQTGTVKGTIMNNSYLANNQPNQMIVDPHSFNQNISPTKSRIRRNRLSVKTEINESPIGLRCAEIIRKSEKDWKDTSTKQPSQKLSEKYSYSRLQKIKYQNNHTSEAKFAMPTQKRQKISENITKLVRPTTQYDLKEKKQIGILKYYENELRNKVNDERLDNLNRLQIKIKSALHQ